LRNVFDPLEQLEARTLGQCQVREDEVRPQLTDTGQTFIDPAEVARNFEIRFDSISALSPSRRIA